MSKPYVEAKFRELGVLMRQLRTIQALDFRQCSEIYGQSKKDMLKRIYNQIAVTAGRA